MDRAEELMRRASELAERGAGRVSPNPLVGAVIVKEGRVIGEGYHANYGGLHAERSALLNCRERGEDPAGAEMFVTLEPCCHQGKQPPCTEAILEAGIGRVYVGSGDPNPKVAGKGIRILRERGVQVTEHVLEDACRKQNEVFFHYITTGLPFGVLKYAMTLDGKTACFTGESRWVTGEAARAHVHGMRNRYTAILAGIGTVLTDDPLLTCRTEGGRNPVRVICDTRLRIPLTSRIVTTAGSVPTIIACGAGSCGPGDCEAGETRQGDAGTGGSNPNGSNPDGSGARDREKRERLLQAGCHILDCSTDETGSVSIRDLMRRLGADGAGIDSVLIEGGSSVAWSALRDGAVQKVLAYVSPKLFGGRTSPTPVGGEGVPVPGAAWKLEDLKIRSLGEDLLLEGGIQKPCSQD